MFGVNVFDYFQTQPAVPTDRNSRFWLKADGLMRQAGLGARLRHEQISECERQLKQGDSEQEVLTGLKHRLPSFSWKRELADLPLFLAVYAGGLEGLYERILVPLLEGDSIQWSMPVSLGLVLQCVWVYLVFKALLSLLAFRRPGPVYWGGIIAAFGLYLAGIWLCSRLDGIVLFSMPVLLFSGLLAAAAAAVWLQMRRK